MVKKFKMQTPLFKKRWNRLFTLSMYKMWKKTLKEKELEIDEYYKRKN